MSTTGPDDPQHQPPSGPPEELHVVWHEEGGSAPRTVPKRPLLIAGAALVLVALIVGTVIAVRSAGDSVAGELTSTGSLPAETTAVVIPPVDVSTTPATPSTTTSVSTAQPDFATAVARVSGSVVRVLASTCQGTGVGTGFWLDGDTVVTSYQSVARTVSTVVVDEAGDPHIARVSGVDAASGVALLRVDGASAGTPLTVGSRALAGNEWVASVGLPSRSSTVSSNVAQIVDLTVGFTHRKVDFSRLAQVPGRVDIGLGGAPVIDETGELVGAVFALPTQDKRLIVPADRLATGIAAAQASGSPTWKACGRTTGPSSQTAISGAAPAAMKRGLKAYFGGINVGSDAQAYAALGRNYHKASDKREDYTWPSTYDFNIRVDSASHTASGWRGTVSFDSIQEPRLGPKQDGVKAGGCARWSIDYIFAREGNQLKINGRKANPGTTSWTKC